MAGGFTTTSAQRSTATSTVSSAVAVVNNPDGTGFAISGPALTPDKVITQIVYVEGSNTSSGTTTVGSGPTITNISYLDANNNVVVGETAVSTLGGNVLVTGTNFVANSLVYVNNSLVANTILSSTQMILNLSSGSSGNVALMIFNPSNVGYNSNTLIRFSGIPVWSTTAISLQNGNSSNTALSVTGDSTLTYALQAGSSLPTGMSLSTDGFISGTPTGYNILTIFTPIIIATDLEGQATQQTVTITVLVSDPYFPYTSLLAKTTGVNTSNNSVIVDNSTNNLPITVTGTPTQGTFSPFSQTGWSNYFGITTDYVTTASSSAFGLGTGDFTVELWYYPATAAASLDNTTASLLDFRNGTNGAGVLLPYLLYSSGTGFVWYSAATNRITSGNVSYVVGQWIHIAISRVGGSTKMYINGSQVGSTYTDSTNYGSTSTLRIGSPNDGAFAGTRGAGGYISNIRILVATGLYSGSTLTVPTTSLTAISNTTFLSCQSNRFIDNSTNNVAITPTGTPAVHAFTPFAPAAPWSAATYGASGYFNGSTDIIRATVGTAPGTLFTIEGWVYLTAFNTGSPNIFSIVTSASSTGFQVFASATNWGARTNTSTIINYTAVPPKLFTWYHVALVRSSSTLTTMYVNGVSIGTSATNYTFTDTTFQVGQAPIGQYINAFIADVRYVPGTAIYNANFTPPTAPLTAISGTGALMSFTNAGIYDAHSTILLQTVGNAQASIAIKKYSTASISFDGTGDYLVGANTIPIAMNTGAFTIEGWAYLNTVATTQYIVDTRTTSTSTTGIALYSNSTGYLTVTMNNATSVTAGTPFTANAWIHFAVARTSSGIVTCYLNGSNVGGVLNTTTLSDTFLTIGTSIANKDTTATNHFNGYLEDIRLTNGYARYTANFTPPAGAMAPQ